MYVKLMQLWLIQHIYCMLQQSDQATDTGPTSPVIQ